MFVTIAAKFIDIKLKCKTTSTKVPYICRGRGGEGAPGEVLPTPSKKTGPEISPFPTFLPRFVITPGPRVLAQHWIHPWRTRENVRKTSCSGLILLLLTINAYNLWPSTADWWLIENILALPKYSDVLRRIFMGLKSSYLGSHETLHESCKCFKKLLKCNRLARRNTLLFMRTFYEKKLKLLLKRHKGLWNHKRR